MPREAEMGIYSEGGPIIEDAVAAVLDRVLKAVYAILKIRHPVSFRARR